MHGHGTALVRRIFGYALKAASPSPRNGLLMVGGLFTGLLWIITAAPPLIRFALSVALAIAWCVRLEKHTDPPLGGEHRPAPIEGLAPARARVHVLATTPEGTKSALETARRLIHGSDSKVVLFVPRVMTLGTPFDRSGEERAATIDRYREIAAEVGIHVTVLLCVCRRLDDVVHQLHGRSTLLIVGGRNRAWWPTRERRLVERMTAQGYPIVFADVGAGRERAPGTSRVS